MKTFKYFGTAALLLALPAGPLWGAVLTPRLANRDFDQIASYAQRVHSDGAQLEAFNRTPSNGDVYLDKDTLTGIREDVNQMGHLILKLEDNRAVLRPWQAQLLDRVYTDQTVLATDTTQAIRFINQAVDPEPVLSQTYSSTIEDITDQSKQISKAIHVYLDYDKASRAKHDLLNSDL